MPTNKHDAIVQALEAAQTMACHATAHYKAEISRLGAAWSFDHYAAARAQLAAERAAAEGMREGIAYNRPPEILVTLAEVYRAARHEAH